MNNDYEINQKTLLIKLNSKNKTMIITTKDIYTTNEPIIRIIKKSCNCYGRSYLRRLEESKKILSRFTKVPIIIKGISKIIFFPLASPRLKDCIWISYNNIEKYIKKNNKVTIIFKENRVITLNVSYNVFNNQINKCLRLEKEINKNIKNA